MDVTLGASQIPNHGHGILDPGHGHPGSTIYIDPDGNHQHDGAGSNHDFVVEDAAPSSFEYLHIDATNVDTAGTFRMASNGVEGGLSKKPRREANTYPEGSHDHPGSSIAIAGATTGVAVLDSTGGGGSHTNMQPYIVVNYMVKT
jgi:microcystin-dependent protein